MGEGAIAAVIAVVLIADAVLGEGEVFGGVRGWVGG